MSPIDSKRKGSDWEREIVKILPEVIKGSVWKRIASSGSIGTYIGEPLLCGDIKGEVENFPKKFRGEAKVGYGGAKQFALKKEWIDKIIEEANNLYSFPFLIGKFSGARSGANIFVVLDLDSFASLINHITKQARELGELYEKQKLEKP